MINFITEQERWVLRRYCEEFNKRIPESKLSGSPDDSINVFIPYYNYTPYNSPSIGFFTHQEEVSKEVWDSVASQVDWCIAMCDKTAKLLPPEKTSVIKVYPSEDFHRRDLILGVIGKECPSGRKRFEFIDELNKIEGVSVALADGDIAYEDMPDFYKCLDYVVITSNNEGGPMPVIEALSLGKPVVAPDVGFAWDHTVLRYDGTIEDLVRVVKGLVIPKNGWDIATKELKEVVLKATNAYREKHGI